MRVALILFCVAAFAPRPAAAQCTGAESQLESVSRALAIEDADKAEQILPGIEQSHPECPEIVLDRARLLALKGDAAASAEGFERYTQIAPQDARGYAYWARFLLARRQYRGADATSALAMDKNPSEPAALALRGQILAMKGQTQDGLNMLEQACKLDPDDFDANFELGKLYDSLARHADAAKYFERAVAINPEDPRAFDYLALNIEPFGEADRVEEAYRKGEAVNKRGARHFDAFMDYNYGRFLLKRNKLKEAKEFLDRAVELTPNVRAVWYERAKVSLNMKDYEKARTDAEKVVSMPDPGGIILDLQTYTLLEQIYRRLGETELAKKYADLSRSTPVPYKESR